MPVKVKICGITNVDDAVCAIDAGADVLGFVFHEPSPRHVRISVAAAVIKKVPSYVLRAGVFVNPTEDVVLEAIRSCGLNLLQFHGDEPQDFCLRFGLMSMKAFRVRGPESLDLLQNYSTDAWLLDAYTPGREGGTGERFDWAIAAKAQAFGRPIFLAGGLTPENVAAAIQQARPFGVDVSSGVESSPGKKDHAKVAAFVKAAKAV